MAQDLRYSNVHWPDRLRPYGRNMAAVEHSRALRGFAARLRRLSRSAIDASLECRLVAQAIRFERIAILIEAQPSDRLARPSPGRQRK